jgi:hypothetical protein
MDGGAKSPALQMMDGGAKSPALQMRGLKAPLRVTHGNIA